MAGVVAAALAAPAAQPAAPANPPAASTAPAAEPPESALAALDGPQDAVHDMVAAFATRRKVIVRALNGFGAPTKIRITIGSDADMAQAEPILVDVLSR
jgi:hypothetical protein